MPNFNKKKTYKKYIYSPFTLLLLFIILLALLKALWGVYQKEHMSARYLEREQKELAKMEQRQKTLTQSVEYMKTDKGIEAEIRNKFRVAKEGESVAVIIDGEASTSPTVPTTSKSRGFWSTLLKWFGSL